jgi:hypothetical protein
MYAFADLPLDTPPRVLPGASDGALLALIPDRAEVYRRVVYYVDTILEGTPPSELPIEEPSKWA